MHANMRSRKKRPAITPSRRIVSKRTPPKPSPVFDTYWKFAAKRQAIYMRRVSGMPAPWSDDEVLLTYKFTNAYRVSDRTTQYLIRRVIYGNDYEWPDIFFRILLFKIFNKIGTWEILETQLPEITLANFNVESFDRVLTAVSESGATIYSAAYIMPSGPAHVRQARKHRMHLTLVEKMHRDGFFVSLGSEKNMESVYQLLRGIPGIGPFLGYQFATDLNYSDYFRFSEMEFVVPGPGALDGIKKCFVSAGDYSDTDIIRWMADRQEDEFAARELRFDSLWGRRLQLIDCQNLFCEVDKYSRVVHPDVTGVTGRARIKQKFAANGELPIPFFPPFWKLKKAPNPNLGNANQSGRLF